MVLTTPILGSPAMAMRCKICPILSEMYNNCNATIQKKFHIAKLTLVSHILCELVLN